MAEHTLASDKKAVSYHYDVGNDFYRIFLGESMVYSCAYFRDGNEDIDRAQKNKLDLICRKLRLKPGDRLLDIGCGWGGLIIHAAKNYGVEALGVTLSQEQYNYAREWINREGLSNYCFVQLKDYRELWHREHFNKVVSVGMFEHVGINKLPEYFRLVNGFLTEDGLFLNHGITTEKTDRPGGVGGGFINRYVFPDGELTNISLIQHFMELAGFEILDLESLRAHYARTLKLWTDNLEANKEAALKVVDERVFRIWLLYMAGCAYAFERGNINIYQVLLSKRKTGFSPVPLTREDIYFHTKTPQR